MIPLHFSYNFLSTAFQEKYKSVIKYLSAVLKSLKIFLYFSDDLLSTVLSNTYQQSYQQTDKKNIRNFQQHYKKI